MTYAWREMLTKCGISPFLALTLKQFELFVSSYFLKKNPLAFVSG